MSTLALRNVCKIYPGDVYAVKDFSMDINDGDFIIFVGPSGCGKSTTLRMIAGLEEISEGELWIDGELMNYVEPKEHNLSMVFQNYALYPNMTVYDNIAYSLKIRKVPKAEIDRQVKEVAKLRAQMRVELGRLHERLGATMIYVTHDQTEAMTLGTRIVVMKGPIMFYTLVVNVIQACQSFGQVKILTEGGVSIGGGSLWALNNQDEVKQDAVWKFVEFLVSAESQAYWNAQTGYFPVTTEAVNEEVYQADMEEYPQFQTATDQLHDSAPEYAGALLSVFSDARATVQSGIEDLLNGNRDVAGTVTYLADTINDSITYYNLTNDVE